MSRVRIATLALATTLVASSAWAAPFTNGSFETGPAPGGFTTLAAGSTSITGWTVLSTNIDYIGSHWVAQDGSRSLDLNGSAIGGVAQTFDTTAGSTYTVGFWIAGNPDGLPTVKALTATAGSTTFSTTFDVSGHSKSSMGWELRTFDFVASAGTTTLSFVSTIGSPCCYGPALDNVTVTPKDQSPAPVPEPASLLLLGTGLLSGARAARRRR